MRGILPGSCYFHAIPVLFAARPALTLFPGKTATMKIVSLVLKFLPEDAEVVRSVVESAPGASVAVDNGDGRMIVLLEDGSDYAVSDSILQIHQIPQVMSTTLSYEYSDEAHALEEN
jgi:nitrate reductase NapD